MAIRKKATTAAESHASKAAETKAEDAKAAETKVILEPTAVLAHPPKSAETKAADNETKPAAHVEAKPAKAAAKAGKTATKKAATKGGMKVNLVFQYMGREISETGLIDAVKNAWSSAGKDPAGIESLELYVKPEDSAVYYVVNETEQGKFDF